MSDVKALEALLRERLDQLSRRVGRIEGDLRSPHDRDWPERASELANDEVLEGLDEIGRGELRQIRAALQRIASGGYGTCARCGQPIGAERLTAIPTAVTCIGCGPSS
jgi:RNA polymerase-binding transcription factor DksA